MEIEELALNINDDESTLYSSSFNYKASLNKKTTKAYKLGQYVKLSRRGGTKAQTWKVTDKIISEIDNAKKSILCSFNHLNIEAIANALVRASKRGVDVKLAVDNQEFKTTTKAKEKTPVFVAGWKAIEGNSKKNAPVRVKFYSHAPSPRYWFLNHHKYLLIDFDVEDLENTLLISGSHNLSKTAEHNQFDNMVFYRGETHGRLYKGFKDEFDHLWSLNRNEEDLPNKEIHSGLSKVNDKGLLYLHSRKPISLTWKEVKTLRSKVSKIAKGLYFNAFRNRNCSSFNVKTQKFVGCPR